MVVEGQAEIKMFCKDYVQRAEVMFLLATAACILVILFLVQFLMSWGENYAHIRSQDKFTDLQDLQMLDVTSESIALTDRQQYNLQEYAMWSDDRCMNNELE